MAMLTVCRNRELKRIHVCKLKNVNNENASTFVDGCVWTCVESVDGLKDSSFRPGQVFNTLTFIKKCICIKNDTY